MSIFLAQIYTETTLTAAGLVIFFSVFLAFFAWVYFRKGAKEHYNKVAQFPLREDNEKYE